MRICSNLKKVKGKKPGSLFCRNDIRTNGKIQLVDNAIEIEVQIKNSDGLHMRPAMQFVDIANEYDCDITVSNGDTSVDGKSIMQMTMLAAVHGTKLKIITCGADAAQAAEALHDLIENKLLESDTSKKS